MNIKEFIIDYIERVQGWVDIDDMLADAKKVLPESKLNENRIKQHLYNAIRGDYGNLRADVHQRLSFKWTCRRPVMQLPVERSATKPGLRIR